MTQLGPAAARPRGAHLAALASLAGTWLGSALARAEEPLTIEVRGARIAAAPKDPDVAASVVRRDRLDAPGAQVADVLRSEPSVSVSETGGHGASSTVSLRGATAAETPIYLAGVRLNDSVAGAADLAAVPPWFLNRIEIYRGNAPLAGDTLGLGGAIYLEPRRPSGPEASVGGMLGSYGARAVYGAVGVGDSQRGALLGVRHDVAQNDYAYQHDNGTRFDSSQTHRSVLSNADVSRVDAWVVGTSRLGSSGRADAVFNASEREQGLPSLALFKSVASRARLTRRLAALSTHAGCGSGCQLTTSSALLYSDAHYSDPRRELGWGATALELRGVRVEHGAALEQALARDVTLTSALRVSLEHLRVAASNQPDVHAQRAFARAALQGKWRARPQLTLRALGSAECHGTAVDGTVPWAAPGDVSPLAGRGGCDRLEPAGRVGVTYDARYLTLFATLGRYARVPTLAELYGTSGSVRGNTALVSEHGASVELGARSGALLSSATGGLAFDVFGFAREARELISYQRSSLGYVRPYNVGAARVLGLEALFAYAPWRWVEATLSVTLTDPRDTSLARPVASVLPHVARAVAAPRIELRARPGAGPVNLVTLAVCYLYQGSRFADRANLVTIRAQGALDIEASLLALDEHLAMRARLSNLLDQTRFDLIGYPLPGRAAYLSLELRL